MLSRLQPYNKPMYKVVMGLCLSLIQGAIIPLYGWFIPKAIFGMYILDFPVKNYGNLLI